MLLYFLRHGKAEAGAWDAPDADRRLTPTGIAEMRLEASFLRRLDLGIERILTSPLVRAHETATIVADALGLAGALRQEVRLGPGFGLGHLGVIMEAHSNVGRLMLVGHEPGFSIVAGQLIGGGSIDVKKGSLVAIEARSATVGGGMLQMLLPPAVLRTGARST